MNISPINQKTSIGFTSLASLDVDSISTKLLTEFGDDFRAVIKEFGSNGRKDEVVIGGKGDDDLVLTVKTLLGPKRSVTVVDARADEIYKIYNENKTELQNLKQLGEVSAEIKNKMQQELQEKISAIKYTPWNIKKSIMTSYDDLYEKTFYKN